MFFHHPPPQKTPQSPLIIRILGATLGATQVPSLGKPPEVRRASLEPEHGTLNMGRSLESLGRGDFNFGNDYFQVQG